MTTPTSIDVTWNSTTRLAFLRIKGHSVAQWALEANCSRQWAWAVLSATGKGGTAMTGPAVTIRKRFARLAGLPVKTVFPE